MYARHLQSILRELLDDLRIVYLTGPRQAGKTTLAHLAASELHMEYVTLDDQATLTAVEDDPHGFIRSLGDKRAVLDEFQYAPALIPAIKEASDRLAPGERGKFLLTGSADIFRSARTQEALPGHMARVELLPLSVAELSDAQRNIVDHLVAGDIEDAPAAPMTRQGIASLVLRGGYPEAQSKSRRGKQAWFSSYMEGRLYKDFETLHDARGDYYSKLRALTPWLAGVSGNLLKYANIANDLGLDDRLSKRYVEMLELLYIVRRVPGWTRSRAKRNATRMPKLHYVDTGLACHLLGLRRERELLASPHYGGLLESLVYMECCKHAAWADEPVEPELAEVQREDVPSQPPTAGIELPQPSAREVHGAAPEVEGHNAGEHRRRHRVGPRDQPPHAAGEQNAGGQHRQADHRGGAPERATRQHHAQDRQEARLCAQLENEHRAQSADEEVLRRVAKLQRVGQVVEEHRAVPIDQRHRA